MPDPVNPFFDFGEWFQHSRYSIQIRTEVILAFLQNREFRSLLDVGCGDGSLSIPLLKPGRRITFLDVSEKVLAAVKSRVPEKHFCAVEFRNEDILSAEFDKSYDVVLCVGVLAHVRHPYHLLRKIIEIVNTNGFLIIQNTDSCHFRSRLLRLYLKIGDRSGYPLNRLSDSDIRALLSSSGSVLEKTYRYAIAPIGFQRIFSQENLYRQALRIHGTLNRNVNTWLANEFIYFFRRQELRESTA
jgi:SAM-dependent methyltransferase